jgi:hypothetical protein
VAEVIAGALIEAGFSAGASSLVGAGFWVSANAALVNTALLAAASYAQSADQKRKLRNQARDSFNASLQDRQVTIRSAVAPRGVLYGRDKVGGQLTDAFVTGSLGQYLHLVVSFYGHECDALEKLYLNNIELPAPDGSGFINSGVFSKTVTHGAVEGPILAGSVVLAHTPSLITSVTRTEGNNTVDYAVSSLAEGVGYTVAGSTVTFTAGPGSANNFYTVNYQWIEAQPKVRVKVHLGQAGQVADADLVAESGGRWTSADVGVGVAYVYFRLEYDVDIFGQIGVPEPTGLWRGKKLFDPRSSTTAWSDNWALAVRDWLRDSVHGLGCTAAEVPDSEINTAANIADEAVTLYNTGSVSVTNGSAAVTGSGTLWLSKAYQGLTFRVGGVDYTVASVASNTSLTLTGTYAGGTAGGLAYELRQKRYTVNGTLGTEDSPLSNLKKLLQAGAGTATWVQGRWLVRAGAYLAPTTTISEDYLGTGAVEIVPRASRRDQCNRVSGTYLDASALYAEKQYPAQVNLTYKAADGGQELTREINYWGVVDSYRAQRLAKIELERSRQAMTVTLQCNHRAYDYAPSDTVNVSLARYGWGPKVFEMRSRRFTPGVGIAYVCKETASTVYQWNLGDATLYNAAAATSLPNPFAAPAQLTSLACDSGATVNAQMANTLVVRGLVTWTQSSDIFVRAGGRIEVEFKLWNDTEWQKSQSVTGDSSSTYISPLQPRSVTLVRVRPVNAAGRIGPWNTLAHSVASGGTIGGGNLLVNSSFEVDSDSNGVADGWTLYTSGTTGAVTPIHSPDGVVYGTRAQRIDAAGLGTSANDRIGLLQEVTGLAQFAGRTMICSAYFTSDLNVGRSVVEVDVYSGATPIGGFVGTVVPTAAPGQRRASVTFDVGPTATRCVVYVWGDSAASLGPARLYIDAAQLEPGSVMTAYAPKADELLAGVVTSEILAPEAATGTPVVDDHDFAGYTPPGSGAIQTWRTFDVTPPRDCTLEFSATIAAATVLPDSGNQLWWAINTGGGDVVIAAVNTDSSARQTFSGIAAFAAAGGVTVTFKIQGRKPIGNPSMVLYRSYVRVTPIYR